MRLFGLVSYHEISKRLCAKIISIRPEREFVRSWSHLLDVPIKSLRTTLHTASTTTAPVVQEQSW